MSGDELIMSSRLRKVEHIEVFDMEGEMVADPFSYTYQKAYYYGNKKLSESKHASVPRKGKMGPTQLEQLRKIVDKMLTGAFCWTDNEENSNWLDVTVRGGSTIIYKGNDKEKFLQKVMGVK